MSKICISAPIGGSRFITQGEKMIGAIIDHRDTNRQVVPTVEGNWMIAWNTGRVDWHNTLAEARDNALKGNT